MKINELKELIISKRPDRYNSPSMFLIDIGIQKHEYLDYVVKFRTGTCKPAEKRIASILIKSINIILANLEIQLITARNPKGIETILKSWDPMTYGDDKTKMEIRKKDEEYKRITKLKNNSGRVING